MKATLGLCAKCVLMCALTTAIMFTLPALKVGVGAGGPATLPLLDQSGLSYLGAFRTPGEAMNGVDFTYGGRPIAFNPANNSLFVANSNYVAEISIPTPVISSDPQAMPSATYLQQAFIEPTEGNLIQMSHSDVTIGGLLAYGNRLYGSASIYYDANNSQRVSHFSRSLQLTQSSFSGWSQLWESTHQGFVAGWMSSVPSEWQTLLGGPAITGQCCIPIVWRTSFGPSAFAFDPAQIGQSTVSATPLLYYPSDHQTLGPWEGANANYGATSRIGGVAIIAGTRTLLFIGSNGLGTFCYGTGTWDPALVGTTPPEGGEPYCYDPTDSAKGQHAYPYRYQIWAYDLNDLAAVKAGQKQPWEVVPYGVWPLAFPTTAAMVQIGGVGYDAQRQLLYVVQRDADRGQFAARPLVHVFKVNATAGTAIGPAASTVNDVTLTSDKTAPQAVSTPITFTAQPAGGTATYEYKWTISDGTVNTGGANWSTNNRFVWTPTGASANYRVGVWVRSAGNATDAPEASTSLPFAINAATTSTVTLAANRVSPQPAFTAITWTATPTGGTTPHAYKWFVSDGTTTTVAANWSTTNTFTWTPSTANANYRITVWVRSNGNTVDAAEASNAATFAIDAVLTPISSVAISANRQEPQLTGTSITWSAVPSGGTAPFVYKWFVSDGSVYSVAANWSASATFNWTPTVANSNYRIRVWVKAASNAADAPEASIDKGFSITAPTATVAPPTAPPPTTPPAVTTPVIKTPPAVSSVTLTANKPSPQHAGTQIVFTAQPVGGVGPYEYQWWTFDDDQWTATGPWMSFNTLTWARNESGPKYQVQVRVRSAGSPNAQGEATATMKMVLNNGKD